MSFGEAGLSVLTYADLVLSLRLMSVQCPLGTGAFLWHLAIPVPFLLVLLQLIAYPARLFGLQIARAKSLVKRAKGYGGFGRRYYSVRTCFKRE